MEFLAYAFGFLFWLVAEAGLEPAQPLLATRFSYHSMLP